MKKKILAIILSSVLTITSLAGCGSTQPSGSSSSANGKTFIFAQSADPRGLDPANTILPSFIPGYKKDVQSYDYNPDTAKSMLNELGLSNLNIHMITYSPSRQYNSVGGQKLAEAVQNYLSYEKINGNTKS